MSEKRFRIYKKPQPLHDNMHLIVLESGSEENLRTYDLLEVVELVNYQQNKIKELEQELKEMEIIYEGQRKRLNNIRECLNAK